MHPIDKALAKVLRMQKAGLSAKVTNKRLATASGLSPRTIIRVFMGQRALNVAQFFAIARALRSDPNALMRQAEDLLTAAPEEFSSDAPHKRDGSKRGHAGGVLERASDGLAEDYEQRRAGTPDDQGELSDDPDHCKAME